MNFRELRNRLISSLWDYIGCPVILSNQVQPEAEPPFCIYTVTAPYIPDGGMGDYEICLLYTSPSPRDRSLSRMPSSA